MENLFSKLWKIGLVILILSLVFGATAIILIGVLSVVIVLLTFGYAKMTGESYEMVCHHSDFIWAMNQWGKSAIIISGILILLAYMI
jgi:hypothetical protein